MGFLDFGLPLGWIDSLEFVKYVREHGIQQFLHTYYRVKDRTNDTLKWGDEIEYHLIEFRPETGDTRLSLTAPEVLALLAKQDLDSAPAVKCAWHPEYGSWMVEATPGVPFGDATSDLRSVERNMAFRRARIRAAASAVTGAGATVAPFSIVCYPLMGVGSYTSPVTRPCGPFSRSAYVSDECISPHPRFGTLTSNIRHRRGRKVEIQAPLFMDTFTAPVPDSSNINVETTSEHQHPLDSRVTLATAHTARVKQALSGEQPAVPVGISEADAEAANTMAAAEAAVALGRALSADGSDMAASTSDCPCVGPNSIDIPGQIHMDAMAFGMGCCCLQVTFQARDLAESRYLYDQLAIISPLMMALTANSVVWRGRLADTDTRWHVIEASVDCRTPAERGVAAPISEGTEGSSSSSSSSSSNPRWMQSPLAENAAGRGARRIPKSRYSSIDYFISEPHGDDEPVTGGSGSATAGGSRGAKAAYNDLPLVYDEAALEQLIAGGVDRTLGMHIAHLFIRDPMVVFSDRVHVDDARTTEHFENVQSTNWRSVRWKPPPPEDPHSATAPAPEVQSSGAVPPPRGMGWRVELRTMEAQLTDFENAAFTVFIVLLTRVLLFFDLNLYMPLSLVDANFERARQRGAVGSQRFYFRRNILSQAVLPGSHGLSAPLASAGVAADEDAVDELSLAEILLGSKRGRAGSSFSGDIPSMGASPQKRHAAAPPSVPSASSSGVTSVLDLQGGGGESSPSRPPPQSDVNIGAPDKGAAAAQQPPRTSFSSNSRHSSNNTAGAPSGSASSPSSSFPGLIPLIFVYLDLLECDEATRNTIDHYIRFVAGRATGEILTGAAWQRQFITTHPAYKRDSIVSQRIAYDLLSAMESIASGRVRDESLLGQLAPMPVVFSDDDLAKMQQALQQGAFRDRGASTAAGAAAFPVDPDASMQLPPAAQHAAVPREVLTTIVNVSHPAAAATAPIVSTIPQSSAPAGSEGISPIPAALFSRLAVDYSTTTAVSNTPATGATAASSSSVAAAAAAATAASFVLRSPQLIAAQESGVRMRGRSFGEEVRRTSSRNILIRALIERYSLKDDRPFDEVPAFLDDRLNG